MEEFFRGEFHFASQLADDVQTGRTLCVFSPLGQGKVVGAAFVSIGFLGSHQQHPIDSNNKGGWRGTLLWLTYSGRPRCRNDFFPLGD